MGYTRLESPAKQRKDNQHVDEKQIEDGDIKRCCGCPGWFWSELYQVFELASTLALNNLVYALISPLSLMFSGHLGTEELGGVALANTFLLIMGTLMTGGLTVACDTVFSQSFGSANKKECGVYLQKSLMIITMMVSVTWFLHMNSEVMLVGIGQNPVVARITGDYLLITMPSLVAHALFCVLLKYLRCQGIVKPILVVAVCGVGVNVTLQYLLVYYFEIGTSGSAYAYLATHFSMFLLMLTYVLCSGVYKITWGGWTKDAFQDWGLFCSLAFAGFMMIQLQWWGFEIGTLMSGLLGDRTLAAQSILFQVEGFTFQVPSAIGTATNIRVGQQLGANSPIGASRSIKSGFALIFVVSAILVALILGCKDVFPWLFTSDPEVAALTTSIIPLMALYNVFDNICAGSSGILRGCGKQAHAATIVFIGMYLVGMPLGLSLMFRTELGIAGFWIGLTCALVVESVLYLLVIWRTDWVLEAKKAQLRCKVAETSSSSSSKAADDAEMQPDDLYLEKKPLLSRSMSLSPEITESAMTLAQQTKYCGEYTSSQPDLTFAKHRPEFLSWPVVICRRTLTLLCCLLIICAGIILRMFTKPDWQCLDAWQLDSSWTISADNRTASNIWNNSTIPVC